MLICPPAELFPGVSQRSSVILAVMSSWVLIQCLLSASSSSSKMAWMFFCRGWNQDWRVASDRGEKCIETNIRNGEQPKLSSLDERSEANKLEISFQGREVEGIYQNRPLPKHLALFRKERRRFFN